MALSLKLVRLQSIKTPEVSLVKENLHMYIRNQELHVASFMEDGQITNEPACDKGCLVSLNENC